MSMTIRSRQKWVVPLAAGLVAAVTSTVHAAGFEILEQSGKGLGTAYAGVAFYNPAAMSDLESNTASANLSFVVPHAEFSNTNSRLSPQLGGTPLSGNMGGDAGGLELVPSVYGVYKVDEDLAFGLGINSPFGLESKYNDTWVGRYHATHSRLTTVNINPAVSYKLMDRLSVGANMQVMYADAKLSNAIDFGTIGVSALGVPTASKLGLLPQQADGSVDIKGDDWGIGMGLGATYDVTKHLKAGVNWRSRIKMHLSGEADFNLPANAQILTSTGRFTDTDVQADLSLPEEVNFGVAAKMSPELTLYTDASWIRWSRFNELQVKYDSPQPDSAEMANWDNVWRYSVGAKYRPCEPWTVRAGFTYDSTPISDPEHRTPRIPDNNRYWLAFGIDFDFDSNTTLGFSYAHLVVPTTSTSDLPNATGAILDGNWDLSVDVATLGITSRF
ncbi:MAG: transporter [Proteobacteria bacterium]|nr:transporter [Pseudomonadota bacterium]